MDISFGPEARMGHSLPQPLIGWGKFVFSVQSATRFFVRELYQFQAPPARPQSLVIPKSDRNLEIQRRHREDGESIPALAKAYGVSNARIHQILHKTYAPQDKA
jgi:hypothetical protein